MIDATGRGYAFRHALTRDAVYQDLLPVERVQLHTAYARALEEDPELASDDASLAATLAVHWYAAHNLPRALAASVRAGREAILLRFLEGKSFQAVGEALRVSEDAARMRVTRTLEILRSRFARKGITSSAAAIGAALGGQAVAAPPGLAASISATAAFVAPVGAKIGFVTFMMTTKTTTWIAAVVAVAALVLGGYEYREARRSRGAEAQRGGHRFGAHPAAQSC